MLISIIIEVVCSVCCDSIVVSTLHCGCKNPGWNPGHSIFCSYKQQINTQECIDKFLNSIVDIRDRALFYRHLLLTVSGDKVASYM